MDPMFLLVYGAVGGGGLLLVVRAVWLLGLQLNVVAFNTQIAKLCQAGNRVRAMKLCRAAPKSPYAASVLAGLQAVDRVRGRTGRRRLGGELERAFDETLQQQLSRLTVPAALGALGLPALVFGSVYPLTHELTVNPAIFAVSAVGLPLFLWGTMVSRRIRNYRNVFDLLSNEILDCLQDELAPAAPQSEPPRSDPPPSSDLPDSAATSPASWPPTDEPVHGLAPEQSTPSLSPPGMTSQLDSGVAEFTSDQPSFEPSELSTDGSGDTGLRTVPSGEHLLDQMVTSTPAPSPTGPPQQTLARWSGEAMPAVDSTPPPKHEQHAEGCPRCGHDEVLFIAQVTDVLGDWTEAESPDGVPAAMRKVRSVAWRIARLPTGAVDATGAAAGLVQAHICRRCGYTELTTKHPEAIPVDGELVKKSNGFPRG